jgi:hypothetical protein
LLAADRLVSEEAIQPGVPWQQVYQVNRFHVYRYPAALPRAFVARAWRTERDDEELTRDLRGLAATGGLGETALIEGSALGPSRRNPGASGSQPAVVRDVTPNEIIVTLGGAAAPGMLVLLDNHYPGWHAADAVSGAPLPIHRADLTFRGIELGRQTRAVRLRYEPATFRFGLFLALLAIAALTAMAAVTKGVASGAT